MTLKGWRKWSVSMATLVLAAGLAAFGKLSGEFVTIAVATIGAYSAANAFTHKVQAE